MKLNKTLSDLKRILASDTAKAERLVVKRDVLLAALAATNESILRAREAINVLEGKETIVGQLKNMAANSQYDELHRALSDAQKFERGEKVDLRVTEIPQNGNNELPSPEPGFVWQKNELGEDMLVPVAMIEAAKRQADNPAPQTAESFLLPAVDNEAWDNPADSLQ